jgi:DNA-binding MarR family transcriptional regulator
MTIGEIAEKTIKDFANVTRIVAKLELAGYIAKKQSETDSRKIIVEILPKADKIKDKVQQCWQDSIDIALQGVSDEEQQQLIAIIDKMERNIKASM